MVLLAGGFGRTEQWRFDGRFTKGYATVAVTAARTSTA
jgi:hypothetical protein